MKKGVATLLSLCLGLFLIDAVVSVVDDTFIVWLGTPALAVVRGLLALLVFGLTVVIYLLMGVTPIIPKRFMMPLVLFSPLATLILIPLAVYYSARIAQIAWALSACQLVLALALLYALQGLRPRWPVVPEEKLGSRGFSWVNLITFVVINLVVLVPAVVAYLAFCSSLAVDHFSGGFVALHLDGLSVRAHRYVRADTKSVHLLPMVHIAEPGFYQQVSRLPDTNGVVLLEGVTDRENLLRHKLSYHRMATSLGLAEQQEQYSAGATRARRADVDVSRFSSNTIEFLNLVTRIHADGLKLELVRDLMQRSQAPALTEQLWTDLLTLRNEHLAEEIRTELLRTDTVVVPWGAAHMPGLASEVEKMGFRVAGTQEFQVIRFRTIWAKVLSRTR